MRLINVDKLIEQFKAYLADDGNYYGNFEASEIIEIINNQSTITQSKVEVNDTVYVLKYCISWEIIECKVKRTYYNKKFKFSVVGKYKNGNIYNGSFAESSINKTVFLDKQDAEVELQNKNIK